MRLQRMKVLSPLLLAAMVALIGGCDAPASQSANTAEQAASPQKKEEDMSELKPPSADSVLYFIYQRDGDGAVSYKVDGGATVSYWYGHAFELNGKHYFTGFGSRSVGEGPEGDNGMMDPEHVAISQATFTRVEKDGKVEWSKPDTDGYVGEFGRLGRADEVDVQHPVFVAGTIDADVIGQCETAFKGAGGDATVQVGAALILCRFAGGDMERAILHLDREFIGGEARHGDRDAIGILGGLFDVVGRIGRLGDICGQHAIHQIGDAVKTDRGTVQRSEINGSHGSSFFKAMLWSALPQGRAVDAARP